MLIVVKPHAIYDFHAAHDVATDSVTLLGHIAAQHLAQKLMMPDAFTNNRRCSLGLTLIAT